MNTHQINSNFNEMSIQPGQSLHSVLKNGQGNHFGLTQRQQGFSSSNNLPGMHGRKHFSHQNEGNFPTGCKKIFRGRKCWLNICF